MGSAKHPNGLLKDLSSAEKRALLAKLIDQKKRAGRSAPLSYAQQRLWFLEQLVPGNPFYNESSAVRFSFPLDVDILEKCLNEIVARHEALRTCFEAPNGEPIQRVLPALRVRVPLLDLCHMPESEREAAARSEAIALATRPFDLASAPLLRLALIRLGPRDHIALLTMHHIICDGWSMGVFFRELRALYEAFFYGHPSPLAPLPIQYADVAVWQRERLKGEVLAEQLAYWKTALAGLQTLELPADRPRPAIPSFIGGRERIAISPANAATLQALCDREGVTPFMALLAAFKLLLFRYTGQEDVAVGCPIANRNRPEIELLIGFFVNTLVLRTSLAGEPTFRESLGRVREVALSGYAHQDLPFERLVEELQPQRDPSRNPLFQVTFQLLERAAAPEMPVQGLFHTVDVEFRTAKFDLRCDLWPDGDGLAGHLEYSADLFEASTISAMARCFERLVAAMVAAPDTPIVEIPLLPPDEERQAVGRWNQTQVMFPWRGCVHERFAAVALSEPDRVAVVEGTTRLTYGQLDARTSDLAYRLAGRGIQPGSLVGIVLDRSIDFVVAVLSVLKAGAAYVPLDPSYPRDRLASMMQTSLLPLVLTNSRYEALIPPFVPRLAMDRDLSDPVDGSARFSVHVDRRSLAYVIFTSGSTGRPRGVEVMHGSLCNLVDWHQAAYVVSPEDRATLYASPGFDASVWEIWPYLAVGASLHVPDAETRTSPQAFAGWAAAQAITVCFLPTPVAESFVETEFPATLRLRLLLTGGDKLRRSPARSLPFRFVNHYGPTENTVVATCCDVVADLHGGIPTIGWPISNTRAYVLDHAQRPVPLGAKGELYLGGGALARGYLNEVERTRERFLDDPFVGRAGARMYRTGDLVRQRRDGALEFHGRVDGQIKIRGYRVEPGDVEAALDSHPAVAKSLVVARVSPSGERSIMALLTGSGVGSEDGSGAGRGDRVAAWRQIYDRLYGDEGSGGDFDIVGWNSSYTGEPLTAEEMSEQVEGTVSRLSRLSGKRVLEIGCGSGLLLLRLAGGSTRYVGTDFSAAVLDRLGSEVAARGWRHVELWQRSADDFEGIEAGSFDVVVLNSVVQYFPDIDYLVRVLRGALRAVGPEGSVFVGDVRSLPLLGLLHAGIECARGGSAVSAGELRERLGRRLRQEQELVIDPAFFAAFAGAAEGCGGLTLEVKRGRQDNELTRFRYDVVLWGEASARRPDPEVALEWGRLGGLAGLAGQLSGGSEAPVLVVRGVPSKRLVAAREFAERLERAEAGTAVAAVEQAAAEQAGAGIDPEDLWALGEEHGWDIQIGWGRGDAAACDLLCVRREPGEGGRLWSWYAGEPPGEGRPWSGYANTPASLTPRQHLADSLRQHLRSRLPDYMIPASFVWLEALPLTANGKLNRQALPAPEVARNSSAGEAPVNNVEVRLAKIWQELLGLDRVGRHDNFFDVGGHSLLLVRVHRKLVDEFASRIKLVDLYRLTTVSALAAFIAAEAAQPGLSALPRSPMLPPLSIDFRSNPTAWGEVP